MTTYTPQYYRDILNKILIENNIPVPSKDELNRKRIERWLRQQNIPWIKKEYWYWTDDDYLGFNYPVPVTYTIFGNTISSIGASTGYPGSEIDLDYKGRASAVIYCGGLGVPRYENHSVIINKAIKIAKTLKIANEIPAEPYKWNFNRYTGNYDGLDHWDAGVRLESNDGLIIKLAARMLFPNGREDE